MGRFQAAISVVIVSQRFLASQELAEAGSEDATLQQAVTQLQDVYNELDSISV